MKAFKFKLIAGTDSEAKAEVKKTSWFAEDSHKVTDTHPEPTQTLEDLKRRLERAEEIMVDEKGRLISPDSQEGMAKQKKGEGTYIKPTRWFAA